MYCRKFLPVKSPFSLYPLSFVRSVKVQWHANLAVGLGVLTVVLSVTSLVSVAMADSAKEAGTSQANQVKIQVKEATASKVQRPSRWPWLLRRKPQAHQATPENPASRVPVSTVTTPSEVTESPEQAQVRQVMHTLHQAANAHDVSGILKFYAPDYVSGDGFNVTQLKSLLEETWQAYPTMTYQNRITAIRISGTSATVESEEHSDATLNNLQELQLNEATKGSLRSHSQTITYLKKVSNTWEITTDQIVQEASELRVGRTDNLVIDLQVPEQVFQGEQYEARVHSTLPRNVIGLSSITQDVLSYPLVKSKGGLRQLMAFQPEISRVFSAGGASTTFGPLKVSLSQEHPLNEMVTAMVAVSEILPSEEGGSNVQVTGLYSLSKRVNVLAKRKALPPSPEPQTLQPANGKALSSVKE
jgi:hypothetical protein